MVTRLATPGGGAGSHRHRPRRKPQTALAVLALGGAVVALVGPLVATLMGPPWSTIAPGAGTLDDGARRPVSERAHPAPEASPVVMPSEPASAAGEYAPAADRLRVRSLVQDRHGRWLARLQVGEADARLVQAGEALARGMRVERITRDGVSVRRGLSLTLLRSEAPVPASPPDRPETTASPPPAVAVIVSPPGREAPSRDAVERAIARAVERAARPTPDRAPDLPRPPTAPPY